MIRLPRPFAALALAVFGGAALLTTACGDQNPYHAHGSADSVPGQAAGDDAASANDFTPEAQDVGACVGTLERPDCGSKSKGGWHMYLTFGVLIAGMTFVGWRVVRSVRQRDAVMNDVGAQGRAPE